MNGWRQRERIQPWYLELFPAEQQDLYISWKHRCDWQTSFFIKGEQKPIWEMLETTEAIHLEKGGSFRLLVPGSSLEVMKSPDEEAVDNYRTRRALGSRRTTTRSWLGRKKGRKLFKEGRLQSAGNHFEIILSQTMPILEEEGHKQMDTIKWTETEIVVSGLWDSDKLLPYEDSERLEGLEMGVRTSHSLWLARGAVCENQTGRKTLHQEQGSSRMHWYSKTKIAN